MKNSQPPSQFLESPLPHSEESEKAILGGIILKNALAGEVFATLQPKDFYNPKHRRIATAMTELMKQGRPIDPIIINEVLSRDGDTQSMGGVKSLGDLTFGLPHFSTLTEYVKIVQEKSMYRTIIRACTELSNSALNEDDSASSLIGNMVTNLVNLQHVDANSNASLTEVAKDVKAMFDGWANGDTSSSTLKTGIPELDRNLRLKGLARGELTLIGARPSTGKTALLIQMATHIARLGTPIMFTSLEMTKEKIVMRMLPSMTGVANQAISPYIFQQNGEERMKLTRAVESLDYPFYFDRSFELPQFIARATHYIRRFGVVAVFFDYLTMFRKGGKTEMNNRVNEVGDIVNGIKEMCVTENVAGVGAAQFSRETEKEHRKPRATDLRDSGVIEQTADTLLFPYDPNSKEHSAHPHIIKDSVWLDIYCAKQRDGARYWSVPVEFNKNLQIFESQEMSGREAPARMQPKSEVDYKDWHSDDDDD